MVSCIYQAESITHCRCECISEAEYANLLKKKIVPLKLEDRYRPDGWLGLIASRFKYYDFSGHRPIKSEMTDLLSALRKMREEVFSPLDENTIQVELYV